MTPRWSTRRWFFCLLLVGCSAGRFVEQQLHPTKWVELEGRILELINSYRSSLHLPPLHVRPLLTEQARKHSRAMASRDVPVVHTGFEERIAIVSKSLPVRGAAENVASNQGFSDPAAAAFEGWLRSPGHMENMKGHFNVTGIGVARDSLGTYYFTQIFASTR